MKRIAKKVFDSEFRVDGEFIHFDSAIGFDFVEEFDPFLLFDMYGMNRQPDQRVFHNPYHAHRGMETITYIRHGVSTHKTIDREAFVLEPGNAILMNAGSGIIHEERTIKDKDKVSGVQIWVNLAKKDKMSEPTHEIKNVKSVDHDGVSANVICGELDGVRGLNSNYNNLEMYELTMVKNSVFKKSVDAKNTVFVFVDQGELIVEGRKIKEKQIGLLRDGDEVELYANDDSIVFYFEAAPHGEPIAWGGTLVMNENHELEQASKELIKGTFGKK